MSTFYALELPWFLASRSSWFSKDPDTVDYDITLLLFPCPLLCPSNLCPTQSSFRTHYSGHVFPCQNYFHFHYTLHKPQSPLTLTLHSGSCLLFWSHQVALSPLLETLTTQASSRFLKPTLSFLGALCPEFSSHLRWLIMADSSFRSQLGSVRFLVTDNRIHSGWERLLINIAQPTESPGRPAARHASGHSDSPLLPPALVTNTTSTNAGFETQGSPSGTLVTLTTG